MDRYETKETEKLTTGFQKGDWIIMKEEAKEMQDEFLSKLIGKPFSGKVRADYVEKAIEPYVTVKGFLKQKISIRGGKSIWVTVDNYRLATNKEIKQAQIKKIFAKPS